MTLPSVKVLIVDDHLPTLDQWKLILENEQHHVLIAHQGQTAYELACQNQPDLILSDLDMPGIDGFQLLTLLKKTRVTQDIPVIICSGTTDPMSQALALTLGAIAYLQKPLKAEHLNQIITEHCQITSVMANA